MKERDSFEYIRSQKNRFSLSTRLTLLVGSIVLGSILISFGIAKLLELLPFFSTDFTLLILIYIISLIVAMTAAHFFSKWFFEPIKDLCEGMQKVSDGNLSTRLETKSSSCEIQEMIAGFNMMTRELESTEILQTDFVSNVSHEFKTPINAIEGYTTLLQGCENLNTEQQKYVDKILFNTSRLSSLVSNILLLSKIENQSIQTNRDWYGLDEQVREAIVALESAWEPKEIDFDVDLDDIEYYGNEIAMRHVWSNLIGNAIKFSPYGGVVKIRLQKKPEHFIFIVEDQGCGLSDEAKKHIFDKFYQEDTSHKEEGNGLGLALVKRILSVEHGEITAENLPKRGCRFTVTLRADK